MNQTNDSLRRSRIAAPVAAAALIAATVLAAAWPTPAIAQDDRYLYRLDAVTSTQAVTAQNFNNRISYTTASGSTRTVRITVRVPPGAASPHPVVIVAHGGGEQPNDRNPATTLPEWGEALARGGYVAINVLHGTNTGADRTALCQAIGYPVASNAADVAAVLQEVATAVAQAVASGTSVSIDWEALAATYPSVIEDLQEILNAPEDESPALGQAVQVLMGQLQGCETINRLGLWDRPYDIAAVVNALHDGELPEIAAWLDLEKVALLGHSNGTSSTLNAVGLQRALPNGVKVPVPVPAGHPRRPMAAVALSPMGINTYGYFDTAAWNPLGSDSKEHSWMGLTDIPVMTMTGDGDNHCKTRFVCSDSDSGSKRRIPFFRMPEGSKYLMYVGDRESTEIVSRHELFGSLDGPDTCNSAALAAECANTVKWIKSTALAFLDAHVRDDRGARSWLRSRKLRKASSEIAGIERK
jgi:hypothetical protein